MRTVGLRLTHLDPRWVGVGNWTMGAFYATKPKFFESPSPFYIGVNFLCPHCRKIYVGALFANPIDPGGLMQGGQVDWPAVMAAMVIENPKKVFWQRTGETFETLSITPSIDTSAHGHWHGSISVGIVDGNINVARKSGDLSAGGKA